jgi:twitching motility protein PilT
MLYDELLTLSSSAHVSDFLIKEGEPLWIRSSGSLAKHNPNENVTRDQIVDIIKRNESHSGVQSGAIKDALKGSGDKDFAIKVGSSRYRANLYYCNGLRLGLALRRLADEAPSLKSLGLPKVYHDILKQSKGLILITGATGSGKTTTLAATLEELNRTRKGHIITLEDPVEYLIKSKQCLVDQRQIGRDVPSFELGLRSALRQDPDILLVGELRDYDTVKTALDAANTGHLVFGTLHTNSAQQSLDRLTSFFPSEGREWANAVLSQALLGIVAQVLVPRLNKEGRVLAAEFLVNTPDVRSLIREGRSHQLFNAMDTGAGRGQVLLNRTLTELVKNKTISEDEALFASYDPNAFAKELSRGTRN